MKVLKVILWIVVALAAIVVIGGLLLPKTYSVSRSITINAKDSVIYNNVANFNNFLKWNPWNKMEPTAKVTVTGPLAQEGHLYQWNGDETGQGQMKITKAVPFSLIDIDLTFIKPFESKADTKFDIIPSSSGTKVVWSMSGENQAVIERWFGLTMDSMIGKDFESGLRSLKQLCEK
jgi:hypothetical protein